MPQVEAGWVDPVYYQYFIKSAPLYKDAYPIRTVINRGQSPPRRGFSLLVAVFQL
jgi:hypothetical protein